MRRSAKSRNAPSPSLGPNWGTLPLQGWSRGEAPPTFAFSKNSYPEQNLNSEAPGRARRPASPSKPPGVLGALAAIAGEKRGEAETRVPFFLHKRLIFSLRGENLTWSTKRERNFKANCSMPRPPRIRSTFEILEGAPATSRCRRADVRDSGNDPGDKCCRQQNKRSKNTCSIVKRGYCESGRAAAIRESYDTKPPPWVKNVRPAIPANCETRAAAKPDRVNNIQPMIHAKCDTRKL